MISVRSFVIAAVLCGSLFVPAHAQSPSPTSWPQFRGNQRLTGVATSTPPASLSLLWKYEVGESIDSSAAIVDDVVYVGAGTGDLVALDLATGKLRWKYQAGNPIGESSPAVARGTVFVGDTVGILHAVRAKDGKRLWTFKTEAEIKSSPVVVDTTVLAGSYDGHLYALDAATGKLRWKFETDGPVHATPAVRDGVVYIAGCDESFREIGRAHV